MYRRIRIQNLPKKSLVMVILNYISRDDHLEYHQIPDEKIQELVLVGVNLSLKFIYFIDRLMKWMD